MKNLIGFLLFLSPLISNAQAPLWQWARQSQGAGHDNGIDIDVDSEGNSYSTGTFQPPSAIIGNDTLYASTTFNSGFYVAKYDRNGNPIWARTISGAASMNSTGIKLNLLEDEVLVTGYYKSVGWISFGSDSISSGNSFFEAYLAKYDSSGNSIWTVNAGVSAWNGFINYELDLDAAGNSYVAGTFEDSIYLKKFDPSGIELWNSKFIGNMMNTFFSGISVNATGESVVAGYFSNTALMFDTSFVPLNSNGYTILLVKSDAQGNVLWAKNDGLVASLYKPDIALDPQDNIYVTGYFNGSTCVFGNTTLTNLGADDIFLVKFSPSGIVQWARSAGGYHFDQGLGIATDLQSNCYITGLFRAVAAFGTFTLVNNGDPDIYVAKYDSAGTPLWAKPAGGVLVDNAYSIAIDDSANCYVTGRFTSPGVGFDSQILINSNPSTNPYELFIARLGADSLTGIQDAEPTNAFMVFPNPMVDEAELVLLKSSDDNVVEIFDLLGSLTRRIQFDGSHVTIHRDFLPEGIYLLRVTTKDGVSSKLLLTAGQ